jgi:ubiquinone/menaquinone biosynthesis C-methylase UbiE
MYSFQQRELKGVAKPKTAQHDQFGQMTSKRNEGDFCDPHKVFHQLAIKEGSKVVDLGAGTGAYTKLFANAVGSTGTVYALDVQKDILQRLKRDLDQKGYTNITYIWANVEKPEGTKIASNSVDFVFISNVLFQVESVDSVLTEVYRILKPKGRVAIVDWSESFNGMGPSDKQVITRGAMLRHAHEARFASLGDFETGSHHYGIFVEKPLL